MTSKVDIEVGGRDWLTEFVYISMAEAVNGSGEPWVRLSLGLLSEVAEADICTSSSIKQGENPRAPGNDGPR